MPRKQTKKKKTFWKALKWSLGCLLGLPLLYIGIAFVLTYITIPSQVPETEKTETIYISSNGVHLDIIIPEKILDTDLKQGLKYVEGEKYLAFGWGDRDFYLHTPTWADLTAKNALKAFFFKSKTLMHITRYRQTQSYWTAMRVSPKQLETLSSYLQNSFQLDEAGQKMRVENQGYTAYDDFYEAVGSYSCFKTCNTWANTGLKQSDITACFWTPFDFRVLEIHQ